MTTSTFPDPARRTSESEFVREIIRIRLYGLEYVQRIAAERLEAVAGKGHGRDCKGTGRD